MGFRFRKSINIGPLRVNLSKTGVGYSLGGKGFRVTKKAGGGTRTTASIPGTGISYVKDHPKSSSNAGGENMDKKNKKKSGKAIAGGLAALVVVGAIAGGGESDSTQNPAASSQISSSVSASQSLVSPSQSSDLAQSVVSPAQSITPPAQSVTPPAQSVTPPAQSATDSTKQEQPQDPEPVVITYIGNSNTMKFHRQSCSSVGDIKAEHKVTLIGRDSATSAGYDACGRCKP